MSKGSRKLPINDVLIIGYGVVGQNLYKEYAALHPDPQDPPKGIIKPKRRYGIGFVCVDTPLEDGMLDTSTVEKVVEDNECDIYVIKSTVPVGFTEYLKGKTGKRIVFSPEYYGSTQHCNNHVFNFTIIGGEKDDATAVQQLLQSVYDASHRFMLVDSKTAEMTKFMENAWLGTKVSFCTEFYRAAEKAGIDYETLRECFVLDPRVNPSHTFVYDDHPYWDSHCLNKDIPSIAHQFEIELLESICKLNKKRKDEFHATSNQKL